MTSGNFRSVPVADIIIDRDNRQRKELTKIDELAESIKARGLIHPPVVTKDLVLIAGERRLTAVKSLGWDMIPVQFAEDLPEIELRLIELEENIKRVDIEWQDECRAVNEYHELRRAEKPNWRLDDTANEIGLAVRAVGNRVSVANELIKGNEMVISAPKLTTAVGITRRAAERAKTATLASVVAPGVAPVKKDKPKVPLLNADFLEWQKSYTGPKFNFIHCDFPYGVRANKHAQGAAAELGGYEDSYETYWNLIQALAAGMDNVVAESAHLIFWFSMDYYEDTRKALDNMGWKTQRFPIYWHKSDNSGILPDPQRGPRRVVETAFIASRNDRLIVRATSNAISSPSTKEIHMSEKPRPVLTHFFRMFVDEYTTMLDPTCGSANSVRVAKELGADTVLGIEKEEKFYNLAKENWQ